MGQLGDKLRRIEGQTYKGYAHWCPACEELHVFATEGKNGSGASWIFDGNVANPTFNPSMLIKTNPPGDPHYQPQAMSSVCHYFLRNGAIEYLGDCTHGLKSQRIILPPLPAHLRDRAP